jgi:hypothetical protein
VNNFTIAELKYLIWAIKYVRERTTNCGDAMRKLERDIQAMIDNYDKQSTKCPKCSNIRVSDGM